MFKVGVRLGALAFVIAVVLADGAKGRPSFVHAGVTVQATSARPRGAGEFAGSSAGNRNAPEIRPGRPALRGTPMVTRARGRSGSAGRPFVRGRSTTRGHVAYRPVPHPKYRGSVGEGAAKLHRSRHPTGEPVARRDARRGIGWFGGTFWPNAHSDIFGFALRPLAYDYAFWSSAYDEVFDDIFWPPSYAQTDTLGETGRRGTEKVRHERGAHGSVAMSRELVQTCDDRATDLTDPTVERIEQTIQPTGRQRTALDDLRAASAKAMKVLKAACPSDMPLTPVGRLDVMQSRLAAMLDGLDIVRPALHNFYDTLSEQQRARLVTISPRTKGQVPREPSGQRSFNLPGWSSVRTDTAQFCGDEPLPRFAELTVRRIEQVVQPSEPQLVALHVLKDAASKAAATLQAACPRDTPSTPNARLDAVELRIRAMLDSIATIRPALTNFYSALSDEQKARFNTMSSQNTLSSQRN